MKRTGQGEAVVEGTVQLFLHVSQLQWGTSGSGSYSRSELITHIYGDTLGALFPLKPALHTPEPVWMAISSSIWM